MRVLPTIRWSTKAWPFPFIRVAKKSWRMQRPPFKLGWHLCIRPGHSHSLYHGSTCAQPRQAAPQRPAGGRGHPRPQTIPERPLQDVQGADVMDAQTSRGRRRRNCTSWMVSPWHSSSSRLDYLAAWSAAPPPLPQADGACFLRQLSCHRWRG